MRKLFATIQNNKNPKFYNIELSFSCMHYPKWFCRIWAKDWVKNIRMRTKPFGQSYGKNKFEAYRLALKDLEAKNR